MKNSIEGQDKSMDTRIVSLGASAMAALYQYNLLQKSNPNFSLQRKLGYCGGAAFICFCMTRLILNNINQI
jgi:hypothetical protein